MTDEAPPKSGEAAWKEQREAISRRNAAAQKRALGARRSRDTAVAAATREGMDREAEHLRDLNARIAKQEARGPR
jgi:hypothetical protein